MTIMVVVMVVIDIIMVKSAPHVMNHRGRNVHIILIASRIMNHRGSEVPVILVVPYIMNYRGSVVQVVLVVTHMNHGGSVMGIMLIMDSIPSWHSIHGTAGSSVHSMGRVGIGWPGDQATDRSVDGSMMIPRDITGSIVHIVSIHGAGVLRGMVDTVGIHRGGVPGGRVSVVTRIPQVGHHTGRFQVAADQHLPSWLNNHLPHGGNHQLVVISVSRSSVAAMVTSKVAAHSIVRVGCPSITTPSTMAVSAIQRSIATPASSIAAIPSLGAGKHTSQQDQLNHDVK